MTRFSAFVLIIALRLIFHSPVAPKNKAAFAVPTASKGKQFDNHWREDWNYRIFRSLYSAQNELICLATVKK